MRAPSLLYLPLVALGLSVAACNTDPVKGVINKFPTYTPPKLDAGSDASSDVTCSGDKEVGATEERTRYESASVPAGQKCAEETQTRTCEEDGSWSDWSGNFRIVTCEVESGGDACTEEGATDSRDSWTATITQTDAGLEGECTKETQTRTCTGGVWGAWSGELKFPECPLVPAMCDDKPDMAKETRTRWAKATVNPGETCQSESQERTCNAGDWTDWTGTFTEMKCDVLEFANCDDQPHGKVQERTMYKELEAAAGGACESEKQTRTCDDGTWSDWEGDADPPFAKEYCDPNGQKRCSKPGGGTVAHGAKYVYSFYPSATVPYGQTCVPDTQEVTCNNGTLPAYTGTATFTSCTTVAPKACVEGGVSSPHGSTRTQIRYESERVAFNATCKSETQTSTCNDGNWGPYVGEGHYGFEECKRNCDGGDHGVTQNRTRYQDSSVAAGQLCVEQKQSRTCTDGTWGPGPLAGGWNGSAIYDEDTCRVRKRDCTLSNGDKLFDGESLTRVFYKTAFPSTACESKTQERLCTDGTLGNWTPANIDYDLLACSKLPATNTSLASCRWVESNTPHCIEYDKPVLPLPSTVCALRGGDWDNNRGCPTERVYATCERGAETESYYVEEDESACTGTWKVISP